jgi:hypothetical protein
VGTVLDPLTQDINDAPLRYFTLETSQKLLPSRTCVLKVKSVVKPGLSVLNEFP